MKFRTKMDSIYKTKEKFCNNPGSSVVDEYASRYDKDGRIEVYIKGKTDFQSYIESFRDSCDLNKMIGKFIAGDPDALTKVKGAFIDVSDMPTTYAEMFNMVNTCKESFDRLDPQIKEKFNNNPVEFYMQYGSEQFSDKINSVIGKTVPVDVKESEVKVDE